MPDIQLSDQTVEMVKEVAKEVAKDVYEDVGHPIAKPTGELVGLVPRAIKAALAPVEKWVLQREYNVAETKKLLEEKLQSTPPDLIQPPEPYIAVPALQYISYCMDNKELRDMYANLLANSMNSVVKNGVHPGFVEIIKQLSPDEAKILKYLQRHKKIPIISLLLFFKSGGHHTFIKDFTNVPQLVGCEKPFDCENYIDNMVRLGLIRRSECEVLFVKSQYEAVKECDYITEKVKVINRDGHINPDYDHWEFMDGFVALTSFGQNFCNICLSHTKTTKGTVIKEGD